MGGNSGSREPNPQAVSALTGFDPGRCFQLLANLHDAVALTGEYAPHVTVGELVEHSNEFKAASAFLVANQHTGDDQ